MTAAGSTDSAAGPLGAEAEAQRQRLLELRAAIARERSAAISPGIARALDLADQYLYLGLGYVGHSDDLFPEEHVTAPAALG